MQRGQVRAALGLVGAAVVAAALALRGLPPAMPAASPPQGTMAVSAEDIAGVGAASLKQAAEEKLHPLLRRWLAERSPDETEILIVTFRDDVVMPPLPEEPAQSEEAIRELEAERARAAAPLVEELRDRYGADVVETFWLVNAVLVRLPLGKVLDLAAHPDVVFIQPQHTGEEPP